MHEYVSGPCRGAADDLIGRSAPLPSRTIGIVASDASQGVGKSPWQHGHAIVVARAIDLAPVPTTRVRAEFEQIAEAKPQLLVAATARALGTCSELVPGGIEELMTGDARLLVGGVKAAGAASQIGVKPYKVVVSPRAVDLLREVRASGQGAMSVGILADGRGSQSLASGISALGHTVHSVHSYRCAHPTAIGEIVSLARSISARRVGAVCFTSGAAVSGLSEVAADLGVMGEVTMALQDDLLAVGVGLSTCRSLEGAGVYRSACPVKPDLRLLPGFAATMLESRSCNRIALDSKRRRFTIDLQDVSLGHNEFGLFASLARRPQVVLPTRVLMSEVWGSQVPNHRLVTLIHRVRQQVGDVGIRIESIRRRGYRLVCMR